MREIYFFLINLRWHYQLFILSGCFLFGGLFSDTMQWDYFLTHLLFVHLLLFGGATAYNTYWDKDEGPVGGLRRVPPMSKWMHPASLLIQLPGLIAGWWIGLEYMLIYLIAMLMFWFYSSPLFRWKGRPLLSLVAIGISTGWCGFWLGSLSAGGDLSNPIAWAGSIGVMFIILSMYPMSQVYQVDEDRKRGDHTFTSEYGLENVRAFFIGSFSMGVILSSLALIVVDLLTGALFFLIAALSGFMAWSIFRLLKGSIDEYDRVMRIKYMTSVLFIVFIIFTLIHVHAFNMGRPVYPEIRNERFTSTQMFGMPNTYSNSNNSKNHFYVSYHTGNY